MKKNIFQASLRVAVAPAVLGLAMISSHAYAQTTPADGADEEEAQIIVTGSRIARPDLESSVPAAVVTQERIQQTGATNIQDALAQLPQVGQNTSRTSTNFSNTGTGTATINLRNLGSSRTLVLINGKRTLGIAGTSAVDVNNIPTDLVQRVEVVTGGASAVYGSDAIAGVVNFILKDKFEGLALHAQQRVSDKGDGVDYYISGTGGFSFGDGRGNVIANFSYDQDDGLRSRDRSFSAHDVPNRSSYAAQGLFSPSNSFSPNFTFANADNPNAPTVTVPDTFTFDRNNAVKQYQSANIDGYDRNQDRYLSVPVERYQGTITANYEFSDAAKLYVEGFYSKTKSNASLEPSAIANEGPGAALSFDGSAYAGIPLSSPYVPQQIRDAAAAYNAAGIAYAAANPGYQFTPTDTLQFRRRSNDIFSRSNNVQRDFYRGVIGLKGDFGAEAKWHYDISYEHAQSKDHTTTGSIYTPNYGAALDNEIGPDGNVRCSDPAARAAGCAPINIFGYNTVSPAAAAFLQKYTGPTRDVTLIDGSTVRIVNGTPVNYDYVGKVFQDDIALNVSGQLFSLWGDPIGISLGAEYRKERSSEVFDPFTQAGLSAGNQITNTVGKFDVKEVFGETVIPIIQDAPLLKYLGIEAAARFADYSTVGSVWSWKVGGEYAPISDIRFRAMFSRATRAPNIGELYASLSQTFPAVTDPCDQNGGNGDLTPDQTAAGLPALSAACRAIPGVASTIAQRGAFYYSTSNIQTIDGLLGGNRNLREEEADTFTAGAVFQPSFLRNFSITADYYSIKVKNAIGFIGQQTSIDQCLEGGDPFFCNNVIRDPNSGIITRVNGININTGSFLVSGLDLEARYMFEVGALGDGGKVTADLMWNHRFKQQQTAFAGAPIQNELGQADCYSCGRLGSGFKDRLNGTFTAGNNKYMLTYNFNYMGPLVDNIGPAAIRIQPYMYHNLKATARFATKYEFYIGVNNIADKTPPLFGDTNAVTWPGTQTVANTYDLYGRTIFFGTNLKF